MWISYSCHYKHSFIKRMSTTDGTYNHTINMKLKDTERCFLFLTWPWVTSLDPPLDWYAPICCSAIHDLSPRSLCNRLLSHMSNIFNNPWFCCSTSSTSVALNSRPPYEPNFPGGIPLINIPHPAPAEGNLEWCAPDPLASTRSPGSFDLGPVGFHWKLRISLVEKHLL